MYVKYKIINSMHIKFNREKASLIKNWNNYIGSTVFSNNKLQTIACSVGRRLQTGKLSERINSLRSLRRQPNTVQFVVLSEDPSSGISWMKGLRLKR